MYYLRLILVHMKASLQEELAYRSNFFISVFYSLLNLATGIMGIAVLFEQVETVRGWSFSSTLALLGVFMIVSSLRGMVFGPSLEALAGIDGTIWTGKVDFTILRPVPVQFLASVHRWSLFSLIDLVLGIAVLSIALVQFSHTLTLSRIVTFLVALCISVVILYAILLVFAGLVFWSPGFLFTWLFDGFFQMARYPIGLYPGWIQFILTWLLPVGVITTVPAQALSGELPVSMLIGSAVLAVVLFVGASLVFQEGLRRYTSASS